MEDNPWISGPIELIKHGLNHIEEGNDFDLRIAMISIDNAVELAIKIFFALNRRSFGLKRNEYKTAISNFPNLLDTLEKYAIGQISDDDLDAIEQFHIIRNNLYHQGIGITVQLNIVERYALLAKDLMSRLFDVGMEDLFQEKAQELQLYGTFLREYAKLEKKLRLIALDHDLIQQKEKHYGKSLARLLKKNKLINENEFSDLLTINFLRNELVHEGLDLNDVRFERAYIILKDLNEKLLEKII